MVIIWLMMVNNYITGWWFWATPLKNDGVRQLGLLFPTEWNNKKCSKAPTRYPSLGDVWGMNGDMQVLENGGTPKSSILIGFTIIFRQPSILGYPHCRKPTYVNIPNGYTKWSKWKVLTKLCCKTSSKLTWSTLERDESWFPRIWPRCSRIQNSNSFRHLNVMKLYCRITSTRTPSNHQPSTSTTARVKSLTEVIDQIDTSDILCWKILRIWHGYPMLSNFKLCIINIFYIFWYWGKTGWTEQTKCTSRVVNKLDDSRVCHFRKPPKSG